MRARRLIALGLSAVAALGGAGPVAGSALEVSALAEWTLRPSAASVAWASPYAGSATVTSGIVVRGTVSREGVDMLSVDVVVPGADETEDLVFSLQAPVTTFTRPGAVRLAEAGAVHLYAGWAECGDAEGWLDLEDVALDSAGRVTRLALDWWTTCDQTRGLAHGAVRWGVATDLVAPVHYAFPPTPVHDFHGATYLSTRGWTPTTAQVEGAHPADFPVVGDLECDASACRVPVAFVPGAPGHRRAVLVFAGGGHEVRVPLEGTALPGHTSVTIDGQVLTPADGYVRFDGAREHFHGDATANDPTAASWSFDLHGPAGEQLRPGVRYIDSGSPDDGTDVGVSRRSDAGSSLIGCSNHASSGWFEFRQLVQTAGAAPAYVVDLHQECASGGTHDATISYLARTDVTPPGRAASLRVVDGVLHWTPPAGAVRTVVRARPGGGAVTRLDQGALLYTGAGERVTLPAGLRGRSARYALFTLDATGNVSASSSVTTRGRTGATLRRQAGVLRGLVSDAGWGYASPRRALELQARVPGGTWRPVRTGTSDSWGRFAFEVTPASTRDYRVRVASSGLLGAAWTPVVRFVAG